MIIDKQLELSSGQAITTSAASTNIIDQGVAGEAYEALWFVVKTGSAAFNAGTSVTIALQTDDNSGFSSATTLFTTAAILTAALTANKTLVKVRIPVGAERYLRAYYTVSGTYDAGALTAMLVKDVEIEG